MIDNVLTNPTAEMAVLGAAIRDADAARKISLLDSEIFADMAAVAVHKAIKGLVNDGKNVDMVNLLPELEKNPNRPQRADASFLVECAKTLPAVGLYEQYVQMLIDCQARRNLSRFAETLKSKCLDPVAESTEIRQWALREIKDIRIEAESKLEMLGDALIKTYQQVEADHTPEEDGTDGRIYSGIKTLDERLGGLKGGLYVAIGARPGVGKSILALTYCMNAAKAGKRVLLVSLEMDTVQITQRVMASESDVSLKAITGGEDLSDDNWMSLASMMTELNDTPLWYSTTADTIDKVRAAAYQLYENGGIDLIAIDYLQLMEAPYSKRQNRQEQISEISRGLRRLAQELNIPILVLTQLNRESVREKMNGGKREPTMADARESGSIEQDANVFALIHEPTVEEMPTENGKKLYVRAKEKGFKFVRIIIDKNRQGKQCRVDVAFDGAHMKYIDLGGRTDEH